MVMNVSMSAGRLIAARSLVTGSWTMNIYQLIRYCTPIGILSELYKVTEAYTTVDVPADNDDVSSNIARLEL